MFTVRNYWKSICWGKSAFNSPSVRQGTYCLVKVKHFNKCTINSVHSYLHFHSFSLAKGFHLKIIKEMSTSRKRADNRKRNAGSGDANSKLVENDVEGGDDKKEIVSSGLGTSRGGGRTTRARKPAIKIEVEDDGENDGEEYSKYFPKKELISSVGKVVKQEVKLEPVDEFLNAGNEEESDLAKSLSPSKRKKPEPVKVDPPKNWEKLLENIKIMRSTKTAAVDTMGCERTADIKQEPKVQRFQTLVSLMLSSQTRDQVTYAAMERLKERNLTVQRMLDVNEEELAELLKPVSFYRRKATYIKKAAGILRDTYDDDIPKTVEDLCALPGVGPKMAYICMNAAWNENAGIGVDTHVHRITNRLKWTGPKGTSTPEKTREALESWLPKELWQEVNVMLVGFGQEICLPIGPKCSTCLNKDICPSAQITRKSKKK